MIADDGTLYQVIVSGACNPAVTSDPPAELTVNVAPTVEAGPNQTVCASSPAAALAGSFGGLATTATWSGAGAFAPNATTPERGLYSHGGRDCGGHRDGDLDDQQSRRGLLTGDAIR